MGAYQVVYITGASSGIGAELAVRFARRGCKVGLMARREELLNEIAERVRQAGGEAAVAVTDVADRASVLAACQQLKSVIGPADLLIANAGIGNTLRLKGFDSQAAAQIMDVNVNGMLYAVEGVVNDMIAAGKGHIVGIASLASYTSLRGMHVYAASKVAMRFFLKGARLELFRYGIKVSTICPGYIKTELTANKKSMPFLMELDEAVDRIDAAIMRKAKRYSFPRRLYWIIQLGNLLPDWLKRRVF